MRKELKELKKRIKKLETEANKLKIELMNKCPHNNLEEEDRSYYCGFTEYTYTCLDCGKVFTVDIEDD